MSPTYSPASEERLTDLAAAFESAGVVDSEGEMSMGGAVIIAVVALLIIIVVVMVRRNKDIDRPALSPELDSPYTSDSPDYGDDSPSFGDITPEATPEKYAERKLSAETNFPVDEALPARRAISFDTSLTTNRVDEVTEV